jgi:hypothetical protein
MSYHDFHIWLNGFLTGKLGTGLSVSDIKELDNKVQITREYEKARASREDGGVCL